MRTLLDGKDVLAILVTGCGKSLIYQCPLQRLSNEWPNNNYVISQLVSLIKDKIKDIKLFGYSAIDIRE